MNVPTQSGLLACGFSIALCGTDPKVSITAY